MKEQAKTAVVTGCNGGIGSATCEYFHSKGWQVIGIDSRPREAAVDFVDFIQFDIGQLDRLPELFATINSKTSSIGVLVNNAAVQVCKHFLEVTHEDWNRVMDVNMAAPFFLVQHLYPLLKAGTGSVVNVSSVHAVATSRDILAYAASKGGLVTLTRSLAIECSSDGVRVNAILPGAVDTSMLRDGLSRGHVEGNSPEQLVRALGLKHLIGRVGQPSEIAKSIFFLSNNEYSSFVTGQCLTADGGATIRLSTE